MKTKCTNMQLVIISIKIEENHENSTNERI